MTAEPAGNPFVGPRPFERVDSEYFFGRDREVNELVSLVFAHRVVLLYAASGAGKTSLLNAGLVPSLEGEGFEVLPVGRVRGMKSEGVFPTDAGNVFTLNLLSNWASGTADAVRLSTALSGPRAKAGRRASKAPGASSARTVAPLTKVPLADYLAERPHPTSPDGFPAPRAVIIDQFEELFRVHPERWDHRGPFIQQVSKALADDRLLRVVFAMREEYLAELDKYRSLLPDSLGRYRLERLGFDAALAAVTRPLEGTGRSFAPGVAEGLVRNLMKFRVDTGMGESVEVDGEAVEPVQLQVVCHSLWTGLPPEVKAITADQVSAFGDVDEVLSRYYSDTIRAAAKVAGVPERELRVWFEKQFITAMGTRSTVYRTRLSTAGMTNDAVDELEARHLVRAEWRAGARWYELTHDRLIGPVRASNRASLFEPVGVDEETDARNRAEEALARVEAAWLESRPEDVEGYTQTAMQIYEALDDRASAGDALIRVAELYMRSGDLAPARQMAMEARDIYRDLDDRLGVADAMLTLALVDARTGDREHSLDLMNASLQTYREEDQPIGSAWTLLSMSDIQVDSGALDEATDLALEALALFESGGDAAGMASVHASLGFLASERGGRDDALRHYEVALQLFRQLGATDSVAGVLAELARVQAGADQFDEAVWLLSEAITLVPGDAGLYSARASALWYAGRYEDAAADYTELLSLVPDDVDALNGRGHTRAEAGRFEAALVDLDRALELADDPVLEAYVRNGRALALAGLGRFEDAEADFEASLALEPGNGFAYFNRARMHQWRGHPDRAAADLRRALDAREPALPPEKRARAEAALQEPSPSRAV